MGNGKEKCEILKRIRKDVAERYGLDYTPSECTHKGDCSGTCPKCDSELQELQRELDARGIKDIELSDVQPGMMQEGDDAEMLEGDVAMPKSIEHREMGIPGPPYVRYKEKNRVLYKECRIAGITYRDLTDVWDELYEGADLALVRQKDNKYDKNAVAVALAGDYDGDSDDFDFEHILGYVPRTENELLARMLDSGWAEAFECELSRVNGTEPDKGSLYMNIYVVSKDKKDNGSLRVLELDDEDYEEFKSNMESQGCSYFRLGGFHPWEHNFPKKGEKVVFMYRGKEYTKLYLMHCIAVGDDDASYFVKDKKMLHALDDCCFYVFTNTKGPVNVPNDELKFLSNEKYDIEMFQSNEISYRLRKIFEDDKA